MMKNDTKYFVNGEELRELLDEADVSINKFALKAEVSPQTVTSAIEGKALKRRSFIRISKHTGVLRQWCEGKVAKAIG